MLLNFLCKVCAFWCECVCLTIGTANGEDIVVVWNEDGEGVTGQTSDFIHEFICIL